MSRTTGLYRVSWGGRPGGRPGAFQGGLGLVGFCVLIFGKPRDW